MSRSTQESQPSRIGNSASGGSNSSASTTRIRIGWTRTSLRPKTSRWPTILKRSISSSRPGRTQLRPSGHFQSGMGVRWNLKFRSYPDVNAQRFRVRVNQALTRRMRSTCLDGRAGLPQASQNASMGGLRPNRKGKLAAVSHTPKRATRSGGPG